MCVTERGKGRQRQAILGEHPSNGYGTTCLSDFFICLLVCPIIPSSLSLSKRPFFLIGMCVCVSAGPHCPLLTLPTNSRYRRSSEQVQDMISYPPLLPKTFPSTSSSSLLGSSSVAMVSGLHPSKMNCSRIFNLFCLYGNVEKVCVETYLFISATQV